MAEMDPQKTQASELLNELRMAALFLTRLPPSILGGAAGERPDFTTAARMFPLVGAGIGVAGGLVLVIAIGLGEPPFLAALLAVVAMIALTGALHEDGLADTADGFGGGASAERKLAIMGDSRIGTYGTLALLISVLIRTTTLSAIAAKGAFTAALLLVAAEAASRAALVRFWHSLPSARPGSLSETSGAPGDQAMTIAIALAGGIVILAVIPTLGLGAAVVSSLLLVLAAYGFTRLSDNQIGGRTGDTLGACQQVAAAAFLIGAAAFA
jgi:adenosylcobinamide-GDP ribazoletransferase